MSIGFEARQAREWGRLYDRITEVLQQFGKEDPYGKGDYWVLDENWGGDQHKVEIHNLDLIKPVTVKWLQRALADYLDWEIVIGIDIPGREDIWPPMGLIVRNNEIIDGLQRQYFPPEYRDLYYEESRPGTDRTEVPE